MGIANLKCVSFSNQQQIPQFWRPICAIIRVMPMCTLEMLEFKRQILRDEAGCFSISRSIALPNSPSAASPLTEQKLVQLIPWSIPTTCLCTDSYAEQHRIEE